MMRYGVSFSLEDIFFTHFHADHFLGLVGLVRTLGLQGRTEALNLYGPSGAKRILGDALAVGMERSPFEIGIEEIAVGDILDRGDYGIHVFDTRHTRHSVGYALVEHERLGRFDPDKAKELGIPEGPLWGQIHAGKTVSLEDGREIGPEELVGAPRPGRKVVLTGDTSPCETVVEASVGADLLIHEGTFGDEEEERAGETGHSTASGAAKAALAAGVKKLALTHLSARYSQNSRPLLDQALPIFPETVIAKDGMCLEVPFPDEVGGS